MRYTEFARRLDEAKEPKVIDSPEPASKEQIKEILNKNGYTDLKPNGNTIAVLTQIPDGEKKAEYRKSILDNVLEILQKYLPNSNPEFSAGVRGSTLGGVVFGDGSQVQVIVKDIGVQGDKSAGVDNEVALNAFLQSMIEKYKSINVTFTDDRNKKLSINNVTQVMPTGKDTKARKKADVVLTNGNQSLPVSIKELSAETWESADTLFGAKARQIINKLVKEKVVKLIPHPDGRSVSLSKEIVVEPTEEEAMNAIFGSDINPQGGIVIQDFEPKHYKQVKNNISIDCHAVIKSKEDIPTSHMMVWLLRNNAGRMSSTLGIRGIRPMASVLNRAIGKQGSRDVILVDKDGNLVKDNPNQPAVDAAKMKQAERERKKVKSSDSEENLGRSKR